MENTVVSYVYRKTIDTAVNCAESLINLSGANIVNISYDAHEGAYLITFLTKSPLAVEE